MKLAKNQIILSRLHPSMLLDLEPQSSFLGPLIVNQNGILVDGYRRIQISNEPEMEVVQIMTESLFETAFALNFRTRTWDEADCFFWMRWARSLGIQQPELPSTRFPEELYDAPEQLLRSLANRKLHLRQVQGILRAPARHRTFLQKFLTQTISLNPNETATFVDMATDLAIRLKKNTLDELFAVPELSEICANTRLQPKQKGEALLKAMRPLRYPYYQTLSEDFSSNWQLFNFQGLQAKKNLFIERGVLEITLSATSLDDMIAKVRQLNESLVSPVWAKIWNK